jgi:hypothetical protein
MMINVEFEVFTEVTMKNAIFWDVAPCGIINWLFGGMCRFHLQGRRNNVGEEKCLMVTKTNTDIPTAYPPPPFPPRCLSASAPPNCRQSVPPKCQFIIISHGTTSQKMMINIQVPYTGISLSAT